MCHSPLSDFRHGEVELPRASCSLSNAACVARMGRRLCDTSSGSAHHANALIAPLCHLIPLAAHVSQCGGANVIPGSTHHVSHGAQRRHFFRTIHRFSPLIELVAGPAIFSGK